MEAIRFLWLAWDAYHKARTNKRPWYCALTWRGVPKVAIVVAVDREAWRISQLAIDSVNWK